MNEIFIANTTQEKERIYNFRHKIYIQELDKHFLNKTASNQVLKDDLDDTAFNFYIERNQEIIGCIRCTIQKCDQRLKDKFDLNVISTEIVYAQLDRFMIEKSARNTRITNYFMNWIYNFGLSKNVSIALIEIEEKYLRLYKAYGFIPYREVYLEEGNKHKRIQMYLNTYDAAYLKQIDSSFYGENINHFASVHQSFEPIRM